MDKGERIGASETEAEALSRAARTNLFVSALLEWSGTSAPVTVRNLSATGALVEGALLPLTGANVRLVRGELDAAASVAWSNGRRCGLALEGRIVPALWMARPGNSGQVAIDAMPRTRPGETAPALPPAKLIADDIVEAIRLLEAQLAELSADLVSAPETVARHALQLPTLDLLAQGLARLRGRFGR